MRRLLLVFAVVASLLVPGPVVQAVEPTPTPPEVLAVDAGFWSTCAIRTDGTLACWGWDEYGRGVPPPAGTYKAVSAGKGMACAIATDGTLACWDDYDGTWSPFTGTFTAVSASRDSTCAIRTDGTLACFSSVLSGQPAGTFTAISAGDYYNACAIRTDGTLACWGSMATPPAGTYTDVSAGAEFACAIATDGTLACWGSNYLGKATPPAGTYTAVSAGAAFACAIATDGTPACWGSNEYGEAAPPAGTYTAVSAGTTGYACAIATDGTLACWGATPGPRAALAALPSWLATNVGALRWSATPFLAPVVSYDVRYRRARWDGAFGTSVTWLSATAVTSKTFTAWSGYTYCFRVRARAASGRIGPMSHETCTAIPLDDRSLSRSSGWTTGTSSSFYRSTYLRSSIYGAKLTRTGVEAHRIALVATTCPTCGSVQVYWGSTLLRTINLYSATTVNRKLLAVKTFISTWGDPQVRRGTLTIKVISSGKKVLIDGVAINRT